MRGGAEVVSAVCAAYGLAAGSAASLTPVARGAMGQIWRLSVSSGSFAVKEFFWGADEEAVRQETRFTGRLAAHRRPLESLSLMVTPAPRKTLVMCHRDFRTGNVLRDSAGNLILLDWDDAGPASPDRELAQLLLDWHAHGGEIDRAAVRETVHGYLAAGGPGRVRDERSFGMAIASRLNFLFVQAKAALDPDSEAAQRNFASAVAVSALRDFITPDLIKRLVEEAGW